MANTATSTIDPREAAHFGAMAADWWDPKGSSAMLHKLNPVRLRYIRDAIDRRWLGDESSFRPLEGKRALDVGCGAGLLTEPLARLGATATGLDAAEENVAVPALMPQARVCWSIIRQRPSNIWTQAALISSPRWRWSNMSPTRPSS